MEHVSKQNDGLEPMDVEERDEGEAQRNKWKRRLLSFLGWTVTTLVVAFLILFISYKVGRFDGILDMLDFISRHFKYAELFAPK